ncbi:MULTISPECIES: tyrosine-protein phosphatase [Frankia]|uniref:tyrosine-protein phosphatase n=1 Tax=Frankia TaxID=1854 RepID=UPI0002EB794F|nr:MULTISPECIES: tyrosine-protein phosphatase [Frankia]
MTTQAPSTPAAPDAPASPDAEVIAEVIAAPPARRSLPLPGTINLRDVGGYPTADGRTVRWRTLLRSGALRGLDGRGRAVLAQIGLRTVVDLREDAEVEHDPDALGRLPATHRRVPIFTLPAAAQAAVGQAADRNGAGAGAGAGGGDGNGGDGDGTGGGAGESVAVGAAAGMAAVRAAGADGDLAGVFDFAVDQRGSRLTAAVIALAAPGALPAIVHCSAGKDRTGLVIALVLDLAGVPVEVIAEDFALTSHFLRDEAAAAVLRMSARTSADGAAVAPAMLASPPELILRALDRIRAGFGDTRSYLLAHGATAHALDRLVDALLAPPHPTAVVTSDHHDL